jgi:hypothetical protein
VALGESITPSSVPVSAAIAEQGTAIIPAISVITSDFKISLCFIKTSCDCAKKYIQEYNKQQAYYIHNISQKSTRSQ